MTSGRRRRPPKTENNVNSQQLQALLALLLILVTCIVIEIVVVDTVFLGPTVDFSSIKLSDRDSFMSDAGAISQGAYLKAHKSVIRNEIPKDQYGTGARIVGLDTCAHYRRLLEEGDGASITVRGLFQNRVSIFSQLMQKNCELKEDDTFTDMIYHVDVENHFPLRTFPNTVLPIVVVEDPLPWMANVCRERPHELELETTLRSNCPALDEAVLIRYPTFHNTTTHKSLAHLWNDWYEPWLSQHLGPRLLIRAEDVMLFPQELVESVCKCLGGRLHHNFQLHAPWQVDALPNRLDMYDDETLQYAMGHLEESLLDAMGYSTAPTS
ncbi:hypothetical protein MHU86_470 [Fragilaria crotonensis]|nr:hypothetical protein MHU86_470 [Fragilaria crotonensis]